MNREVEQRSGSKKRTKNLNTAHSPKDRGEMREREKHPVDVRTPEEKRALGRDPEFLRLLEEQERSEEVVAHA